MADVTVPPNEWTDVQGYELRHDAPGDRVVHVDDAGAVHLPPAEDTVSWAVRDARATAPITYQPDPPEDPAGRFELVDGTWRPRW